MPPFSSLSPSFHIVNNGKYRSKTIWFYQQLLNRRGRRRRVRNSTIQCFDTRYRTMSSKQCKQTQDNLIFLPKQSEDKNNPRNWQHRIGLYFDLFGLTKYFELLLMTTISHMTRNLASSQRPSQWSNPHWITAQITWPLNWKPLLCFFTLMMSWRLICFAQYVVQHRQLLYATLKDVHSRSYLNLDLLLVLQVC